MAAVAVCRSRSDGLQYSAVQFYSKAQYYSTVQYSVQVTLVVYIPQELLAEVAGRATTATSWLVTRSFQDIVRLVDKNIFLLQ